MGRAVVEVVGLGTVSVTSLSIILTMVVSLDAAVVFSERVAVSVLKVLVTTIGIMLVGEVEVSGKGVVMVDVVLSVKSTTTANVRATARPRSLNWVGRCILKRL